MSGYCACDCRDCFDIAIAGADDADVLCADCAKAGCEANNGDCQRADAYGMDEACQDCLSFTGNVQDRDCGMLLCDRCTQTHKNQDR